jgi:cytosine/adenosine deaminase-related metal-dependent hydrolase
MMTGTATHDLVIRGGLVVDGTGAPARRGDVAVRDGRLSEVGAVTGRGTREIDAAGLAVAPGFIDPHTHYDAQITWDPLASCSSWHRVVVRQRASRHRGGTRAGGASRTRTRSRPARDMIKEAERRA